MQPTYQPVHQQQPNVMMTPPSVVTTKDLMYLKDAMSWQLDAMKKYAHFAGEVQDPQIRQAINKIGQMHQHHYNMLLKHCQNNNTMNTMNAMNASNTGNTLNFQ